MSSCVDCGALFEPNRRGRPRIRCHGCSPAQSSPTTWLGVCAFCGDRFIGRAPSRRYCTPSCKWRAQAVANGVICAGGCGTAMWGGGTSLPPGERMCRPCRAERRAQRVAAATPRPPRRRAPRGTVTERGYGASHRKAREHFLSRWAPGDPCVRCFEPMLPGELLDLDHSDDRSEYLGLSHAECNRGHIPVGGTRPAVLGRGRRPCPICGASFLPSRGGRTCSRPCGWEMRRRDAAA